MRIVKIAIKNFRALKELPEVTFNKLPTIVGKNDAGKSSILHALNIFFEKKDLEPSDFYHRCKEEDEVVITVPFTDLPGEIELEPGIKTNLEQENLLGSDKTLIISKRFKNIKKPKPLNCLIVEDFEEYDFQNLCSKKQNELNEIGKKYSIDFPKSGASITNKWRREVLREKAVEKGLTKREIEITPEEELFKKLWSLLPTYILFCCDTSLDIDETQFQNQFQPIIDKVVADNVTTKAEIEAKITEGFANEFGKILDKMKQYTDTVTYLDPVPTFQWNKLVKFDLKSKDTTGANISLDKRGAGTRRLLMVAFFQYLTERTYLPQNRQYIFAIEEPETYLHPGLQRDLVNALLELTEKDQQVIITTHSPVFAGSVEIDDLLLMKKDGDIAIIRQFPELDLEKVAEELGVDPRDKLFGYNACIFVEGPEDIKFLEGIAEVLKSADKIGENFNDKKIGFIIVGGDNLRHYIERKICRQLGLKFAILRDSDLDPGKGKTTVAPMILNWKKKTEEDGGVFIITRKKEIENYLHPIVFRRVFKIDLVFDDFTDVRDLTKRNGICLDMNIIKQMTADEILERDKYIENGQEKHEILEMLNTFLGLT
jgi:predicted ATP-dependent endonuclease of OLD family